MWCGLKIIEEDLKKGWVKILVEDEDDLWVLYNLLSPGDIVYGRTSREVKQGEGGSSRRVSMTLGLRLEKLEFQEFSDRLRVRGIVVDGPEEFGVKGHYHTINLSPGDTLVVFKEKWSASELEALRRSSVKKRRVMLVNIDHDEACIAVLTEQGVIQLSEAYGRLPGKMYASGYDTLLRNYLEEVLKLVSDYASRERVDALVVAGPGDLKNTLADLARSRVKGLPVYVDSTSIGGCSGLNELLRRDVVKKVVSELSVIRAREVFEVFKRLVVEQPDRVAYGVDEAYCAALMSAVDKLVVVSELIKSGDDGVRSKVLETLDKAFSSKADIWIIPGRADIGVEVGGFGGIIAVLRYPLQTRTC
jgi:protein pelota